MAVRVAIMGTRGIPARYGGFETFAEELSKRLLAYGYHVTVYSRHALGSVPQSGAIEGVAVRSSLTIMHKYLETPLATLTSFLDLVFRRYDVILLCNAANSPFGWIPRLLGIPLAINVDGIERERKKWNALGRLWYRLGERCSVWFASRVIADAKVIQQYYQEEYGCDSEVIAYGATVDPVQPGSVLSEWNLIQGQYLLYVSRLEPENNALGVIEAYVQSGVTLPLVIVGDAPYADDYKARLQAAANERVIFTGFQFGAAYRELRTNCLLYVQATEVGGTHPALVEGMAYGNCVIANGTPENIEVLGDAGLFYEKNNFAELAQLLQSLVADPDSIRQWGKRAAERARKLYSWEAVAARYDELFSSLVKKESD